MSKFIFIGVLIVASMAIANRPQDKASAAELSKFMDELKAANKKSKWNPTIYSETNWRTWGKSTAGRPLIYYVCGENNKNTTLILSAVHGDEVTPVYFGFRSVMYVKGEPDLCKDHRVVIAPLVNPDGYLATPSSRLNKNGIDLNRNFPTHDFSDKAQVLWQSQFKADKRRNPGTAGGSEPETQFQQWLIEEFQPSKILTVHSPLNFFDYDGPTVEDIKTIAEEYIRSCNKLRDSVKKATGSYKFLRYGFYPGSLGNYAGKERGIPTLTLELPTSDASRAKAYFEQFKKGTRQLITYEVKGKEGAMVNAGLAETSSLNKNP